nr:phosphoribosyltransferase [Marinicella sp. W31]MDC2878944.1 phosphoribosyltransferase [Marinicella sp. W31]
MHPYEFWQDLLPPQSIDPHQPLSTAYPATLADGRQLLLPIRALGDSGKGLASLIINQASFAVTAALATDLAGRLARARPDLVVGLPTLGLTLAASVAGALGHSRYVPLGNSRKFWYEDALSMPVSSVTTPNQEKRLFIDPRMLPLLSGKRVALVDDVISSGRSILSGLLLLEKCGVSSGRDRRGHASDEQTSRIARGFRNRPFGDHSYLFRNAGTAARRRRKMAQVRRQLKLLNQTRKNPRSEDRGFSATKCSRRYQFRRTASGLSLNACSVNSGWFSSVFRS